MDEPGVRRIHDFHAARGEISGAGQVQVARIDAVILTESDSNDRKITI